MASFAVSLVLHSLVPRPYCMCIYSRRLWERDKVLQCLDITVLQNNLFGVCVVSGTHFIFSVGCTCGGYLTTTGSLTVGT